VSILKHNQLHQLTLCKFTHVRNFPDKQIAQQIVLMPNTHTHYSILNGQYSILNTQYSFLNTQTITSIHCSELKASTQYLVLHAPCSITQNLSSQYSRINIDYSILITQYSILNIYFLRLSKTKHSMPTVGTSIRFNITYNVRVLKVNLHKYCSARSSFAPVRVSRVEPCNCSITE
jgi:hypothetical protein